MSLFARSRDTGVKSFVLKLVNNHCPGLKALADGPRSDSRVAVVVPAIVVPLKKGTPQFDQGYTAITKEFSNTGVAIVVEHPSNIDEALLGFRLEGQMTFLRAKSRHLDPIGGGFFAIGFQLLEVVTPADYQGLDSLDF
ncbi:MAG: hypothetical protein ABFC63_07405 [Thermoguttaceae bacterium]